MSPSDTTVAIVDDDPAIVDLYWDWLREDYEVRTATGGEQALQIIDEDVDVVLLDRRMPDVDGDTVLRRLRADGIDAMVAMNTAVEPTEDIVDLPFDDYVVKPTRRDALETTVASLRRRAEYSDIRQRCFRLASKIAALEQVSGQSELEASDVYSDLKADLDQAQQAAHRSIEAMVESDAIERAYSDL